MRPHWNLQRIKTLARENGKLWVKIGRAVSFFPGDRRGAVAAVQALVSALSERHLIEIEKRARRPVDVYAVQGASGVGWRVAVILDEENESAAVEIEPIQRPIKTDAGWVNP